MKRISRASLKNFFGAKELRVIATLLLQETILLALVSLAILLSFESILPGTVSLRESILFFILGIALALSLERILAKTFTSARTVRTVTSRKMRLLSVGFIFWATFLFGNALFGFHPIIIAITLLIASSLLWLFFTIAFEENG